MERTLRVACVTETYWPEVNGVASTLRRFVEGLRERGHDVQLVRPRQGPDDRPAAAEQLVRGMPIPRYPALRLGLPAGRRLRALWQARRPDLVHIATPGPLGASALRAARALGLPVATDYRTNFDHYCRHYGLGALQRPVAAWLRRFHNGGAATLVPTEALRRALSGAGFERLAVVARGVDGRGFDPARRSEALRAAWGAGPHDPVLLYVGRLAAEKNLGLLCRAHAAVRRRHPGARLVLVGDGPLRETLAGTCPDAVFAGARRGDELAAHYASADLFVFPSLTETFGNVTVEALASGLPVVAFDHAAAGELIVPGVHGELAVPGNEAGFVERVLALAADAGDRRRMGRAARWLAEMHDWPRVVADFERVLRQAAQDGAAAAAAAQGRSGGWRRERQISDATAAATARPNTTITATIESPAAGRPA